jgi:hypothetical protein
MSYTRVYQFPSAHSASVVATQVVRHCDTVGSGCAGTLFAECVIHGYMLYKRTLTLFNAHDALALMTVVMSLF